MKSLVVLLFIASTVLTRTAFAICAFGCSFMTMTADVSIDTYGGEFNHVYRGNGRVACYNNFMNPMPGIADNNTWTVNTSLGMTVAEDSCPSCCMDQAGVWNGATGGAVDPRTCYTQRTSSSNPQYSNEVGTGETCDTPLVLDLSGAGVRTTSLYDNPTVFDYRGTSIPKVTGWTAGDGEAAFLYYDTNNDHTLSDGRALFGNAMRLPRGTSDRNGSKDAAFRSDGGGEISTAPRGIGFRRAHHGFEVLAAYDRPQNGGNGDRVISPADNVWKRLRLWIDRNHDGKMSPDEDYSLDDFGMSEISLTYRESSAAESFGVDEAGNYHYLRSTFLQRVDGKVVSRDVDDILFRTSQ